jgi:glycosyltransferase involved in cell wall biosynthesis
VITAIGVIVPARNEQALLPACLDALSAAVTAVAPVPARVCVVADACTDRTASIARAAGAKVITVSRRNVGAARAAGMTAALRLLAEHPTDKIWLATTDADSTVPSWWLERQLGYAAAGWDGVAGTVAVGDWAGHPPHVPAAFAARYEFGEGPHPHVHGANLGCRASAYLASGGFRRLTTAEDHELLRALDQAGCAIHRSADIQVTTSSRRHARAPAGFSHLVCALAAPGQEESA